MKPENDARTNPTVESEDSAVCFECGVRIASIAERGLAVTEGIVLCERCCEQHDGATKDSVALKREVP